jgi:hypothetical protein
MYDGIVICEESGTYRGRRHPRNGYSSGFSPGRVELADPNSEPGPRGYPRLPLPRPAF